MKLSALILAAGLALNASAAFASPLSVTVQSASTNLASPQMGDTLQFHSVIRNDGGAPIDGVIAWISLVQVDKGKEQPVDLEDWSAHKAVTAADLQPGGMIETDWPMRLIQAGHYRVVISAASRSGSQLTTSPFADFAVRQKAVVESERILPVALGIPLLLAGAMAWRWKRYDEAGEDNSRGNSPPSEKGEKKHALHQPIADRATAA